MPALLSQCGCRRLVATTIVLQYSLVPLSDIIAVVMIVSGSFSSLVDYFSAAAWVFYFLAVLSLLMLRRRRPDAPRPFRCEGTGAGSGHSF